VGDKSARGNLSRIPLPKICLLMRTHYLFEIKFVLILLSALDILCESILMVQWFTLFSLLMLIINYLKRKPSLSNFFVN